MHTHCFPPLQLKKSRGKNASKPATACATTLIKKNARRTNFAVGAEAQRIRPDLKASAYRGVHVGETVERRAIRCAA